jgi:hypothetical protein
MNYAKAAVVKPIQTTHGLYPTLLTNRAKKEKTILMWQSPIIQTSNFVFNKVVDMRAASSAMS